MIVGELIKISSTVTQQLFMTTSLPAARSPPDGIKQSSSQAALPALRGFDAFWRSKGEGARASLRSAGMSHQEDVCEKAVSQPGRGPSPLNRPHPRTEAKAPCGPGGEQFDDLRHLSEMSAVSELSQPTVVCSFAI